MVVTHTSTHAIKEILGIWDNSKMVNGPMGQFGLRVEVPNYINQEGPPPAYTN